jgi:hypothetical protein
MTILASLSSINFRPFFNGEYLVGRSAAHEDKRRHRQMIALVFRTIGRLALDMPAPGRDVNPNHSLIGPLLPEQGVGRQQAAAYFNPGAGTDNVMNRDGIGA